MPEFLQAALDTLQPLMPEGMHWGLGIGLMLLAALITGIAKSGFGGGVGILAVPLVANALRPEVAIGVMLPVLIAGDIVATAQNGKGASKKDVTPALVGALIGIGLGTALLAWLLHQESSHTMQRWLGGTVGSLCLLMVGLQIHKALGGRMPDIPQNRWTNAGAGTFAGLASTLAHAAGPIMTLHWLQAKWPKPKLIGSLVVFFLLVNTTKLLPYIFLLGLINKQTLIGSLVMAPAIPVGALLGHWMQHRIPEKPFTWIMYGGVLLAGGRLLFQAFA